MATNSSEGRTFGLLPEPERNPRSFITSVVVNLAIAVAVVMISLAAKKVIQQPKVERTDLVFTPPPPPPPHIKIVVPKMPPPPPVPQQAHIEMPKPVPQPPTPKPVEIKQPEAKPAVVAAAKPQVILKPQPKVALAMAAAPALQPQAHPDTHPVHFGDLNGVQPNPNANRPATVSALGNPAGGNSGPSAAPRGVVGSAGFGNGMASGSNAGTVGRVASAGIPGGNGTGNRGGFGNGRVGSAGLAAATQQTAAAMTPAAAQEHTTNPDVTYSPRPAYSEEAKRLGIQGDVVLRVRLTASGQVVVLGVVRGLGHGLDELAQRAAQSIRFKPATRNGQPVDFTTNISISFQLA